MRQLLTFSDWKHLLAVLAVLLAFSSASAADKPRARTLGIPFDGTPGPLDAITDVAGLAVGYTTLISGEGKLQVGEGPVRTGVTAILPRGLHDTLDHPVFAGRLQPERQRRDDRRWSGWTKAVFWKVRSC